MSGQEENKAASAGRGRASLSGIEVRVLVRELDALSGSYVSSIHSLGDTQVMRLRRPEGEERNLVIAPGFGAWITKDAIYGETTEFATALRGRILRSILLSVSQHDLDRVFIFTFSVKDGGDEKPVSLILELMPPGNIVLTDKEGRIILLLREARGKHRTILRGGRYSPPPQSRVSPESLDARTLSQILSQEKTVGKALGRGLSLPRKYVGEILARAAVSQDTATPLSEAATRGVESGLREIMNSTASPTPSLVADSDDSSIDILAIRPRNGRVLASAATMNELVDQIMTPLLVEEQRALLGSRSESEKELLELRASKQRLEDQIRSLQNKASEFRGAASAVRGSETLASALDLARSMIPGSSSALKGIDEQSSVASVASSLYDQAKQYETETKRVREAAESLSERIEREAKRASHGRTDESSRPSIKVVATRKKEWYEKFRWFFTTQGKLAVGGRDAQSNSTLVKRYLDEEDVAYHADLFGSPFFVLKDGRSQSDDEIREMAQATVSFSSAWKSSLAAADAFWVEPAQVSTTAPSGEYLPRGSFVIRGKKNFVAHSPVEISVGVDSKGRLVAGPEKAVLALCDSCVTLTPSRDKTSDTAKKVLAELRRIRKDTQSDENPRLTVDDVLRVLPAGGGKIIRRKGSLKGGPI